MTKSKRNRKNNKNKEVYEYVFIEAAISLKEAANRALPIKNSSFEAFHYATSRRDFQFFKTMIESNYELAREYEYLPYPMVAICRDANNNLFLMHGITQVSINNHMSEWNGRWVGFSGTNFQEDYNQVQMFAIRGKITKPLPLYKHEEKFYKKLNKDDYGMIEHTNKAKEGMTDTSRTRKLLLLQPNWVMDLCDVHLDVPTVYSYFQNVLKKENLTSFHREVIKNFIYGLVHKGVSRTRLAIFEMDDEVKQWKKDHLYKTYGNPNMANKHSPKVQKKAIEQLAMQLQKENNKRFAEVHELMYSTKIGERLYEDIGYYMHDLHFHECFYEYEDTYHSLKYVKEYADFNGVIDIKVERKEISICTGIIDHRQLIFEDVCALVENKNSPLYSYSIVYNCLDDNESIEEVD